MILIIFFIQLLRAWEILWFMLAPRQVETVFMGQQWLPLSLIKIQKKNVQLFKLETLLQKNYYLKLVLELMAGDSIIAIQDMGAAGLTSSAFEMASKGGVGVEMDLDKVPAREVGMTAYEFLLSESQERMLMVIEPGKEHVAQTIMEKWELDFAIVGQLTDTGRMVIKMNGKVEADLPIDPLALASPEYDRPWIKTEPQAGVLLGEDVAPMHYLQILKQILSLPDMCSRRWIWEQYDHMVMGNTVQRPGGDAAVYNGFKIRRR